MTIEGREQDVFVPREKTKGAMHGDKVLVVIEQESDGGRRAEGSIVRILEHANQELVLSLIHIWRFRDAAGKAGLRRSMR